MYYIAHILKEHTIISKDGIFLWKDKIMHSFQPDVVAALPRGNPTSTTTATLISCVSKVLVSMSIASTSSVVGIPRTLITQMRKQVYDYNYKESSSFDLPYMLLHQCHASSQ